MSVSQGVQELAPLPEYVFLGQGSHEEEPGVLLNVPGLQGKHSDMYATPERKGEKENEREWEGGIYITL